MTKQLMQHDHDCPLLLLVMHMPTCLPGVTGVATPLDIYKSLTEIIVGLCSLAEVRFVRNSLKMIAVDIFSECFY